MILKHFANIFLCWIFVIQCWPFWIFDELTYQKKWNIFFSENHCTIYMNWSSIPIVLFIPIRNPICSMQRLYLIWWLEMKDRYCCRNKWKNS
jgi:hypothetical protein